MAFEQVRQASKILGPLLRRRGTSPAVGASLRKAVAAIDKSLAGVDAQKQAETVREGVAELRACIRLIQASDRPPDHDQLEGITKALAILAPEEEAAPSTPLPPVPIMAEPAQELGETQACSQVRRRRRARGPTIDISQSLRALAAQWRLLHETWTGLLFQLYDVEQASETLTAHLRAMQWLAEERVPAIMHAIDEMPSDEERLAAGAVLVHVQAPRCEDWLLAILERAAASQSLPAACPTVLRTVVDRSATDLLLEAFLKPASPAVCGLLLPLLADQGRLSDDRLWNLVFDARDEVAISAAHALWLREGPFDVPMLLRAVLAAKTTKRAHALLLTAAVLGSVEAVTEARARLQKGRAFDEQLALAVAVGGTSTDAPWLLHLNTCSDEDAARLTLAAAHLGNAGSLTALCCFSDRVPRDILREAESMVLGPDAEPKHEAEVSSLRLLRGQPWSVAHVLDRLAAADEPLQSRRHLAVELRVRAGVTLPPVPAIPSCAAWCDWVDRCKLKLGKSGARLDPGQWYYRGKPIHDSVQP